MSAAAVLVVFTVAITVLVMAVIPPGRRARGREHERRKEA